MSRDKQVLSALAMKTGHEMRYFEFVTIVNGESIRKCIVSLGKHALFFVRQDMNSLIHMGGELYYSHVTKVVKDSRTARHMVLMLHENSRPEWTSDRIFIQSDCREELIKHLRCNWETDYMWRLGRVASMPLFELEVTMKSQRDDPLVDSFGGFKWQTYMGYRLMVPIRFEDQANSIQSKQTGEFVDPETGTTLVMQVHELMTFDQLKTLGRSHIRWVAAEYKANLVKGEDQFYVLRNAPHQKKMNLTGDIAAWYAWELIIRTKGSTLICMLLRRQYAPPLCSGAQDIALIMRSDGHEQEEFDVFLKNMQMKVHLVADSVCTDSPSLGVYMSTVQAKLDALRFDEEGVDWVSSHLKLRPMWHEEAKRFVRGIIKILHDDGTLVKAAELLDAEAKDVLVNAEKHEKWKGLPEIPEIHEFIKKLVEDGKGLPDSKAKESGEDGTHRSDNSGETDQEERKADAITRNLWNFRVARYLAWAVDGGLMGNKFTLDILLDSMRGLQDENQKRLTWTVNFMLHLRQRDMKKPWTEMGLTQLAKESNLGAMIMNDRVMHSVLSTETLRKQFGRGREVEYFQCLATLLTSVESINLKSYICRLFMELKAGKRNAADEETSLAVAKPLVTVLQERSGSGTFLATYAVAALVNLCSEQENVKKVLMGSGISKSIVDLLRTKDDDVMLYALMLTASLSKESHHRHIFGENGLPAILYDTLTSSYHLINHHGRETNNVGSVAKERILAQVCIVIGQLCNDDVHREHFVSMFQHTVDCLLYLFEHSFPGSALQCKVMFALKQLIAHRNPLKERVGDQVITKLVVHEIKSQEVNKDADFLMQSVMLLQMLTSSQTCCEKMAHLETANIMASLTQTKLGKQIEGFNIRVRELQETLFQRTVQMRLFG